MESNQNETKQDEINQDKINQEKKKREIIVIGAGMAGLLIAYYLKKQGKDVLVLEANAVASGQTGRTTAKITSQHALKYHKLMQSMDVKKAMLYARANEEAIAEYERLIREEKIECRFKRVPAYLYTSQNPGLLKQEAEAASLLGIDAFFTTETELPFEVTGAVCFRNQAQFSPMEFVKYIAAKLEIMEHTKVIRIRGNRLITESGEFLAEKIIMATHYPIRNVPGFYFMREHQERSCVLELASCDKTVGSYPLEGMYYGIDSDGLSFRQAGENLLLGGGSYRTGENEYGGTYEKLVQAAKQYFPECKEVSRWSAQDCMPHDGIPFIGRFSVFTPNLYVATGFQKWGMTTSMVAAMLLRDMICGIENPYAKLFAPQRFLIRAATGNFLKDVGMSVKGLVKGFFHKKAPRCAHMGCELVWNPDEQSYDCPCHGSRYDADGKLLDNPSVHDLQRKKCDSQH
ncbi:MAG: FAD-dependent oxidoreductase [Lachnospiraceae bacterium]|nr:FAD-dependent oxidoreductase [Lachnospiraceae bacterium]